MGQKGTDHQQIALNSCVLPMNSQTSTKTFNQQKRSDPPMLWIVAILGSVFLHGLVFWILRLSIIRSQIVPESRSAAVNLIEITPSQKSPEPKPANINKVRTSPPVSKQIVAKKSILVANDVPKKITKSTPTALKSANISKNQDKITRTPPAKRNNLKIRKTPKPLKKIPSFTAVRILKNKQVKQPVPRHYSVKIPLNKSQIVLKPVVASKSQSKSIAVVVKPEIKSPSQPKSIVAVAKTTMKPQSQPQSIVAVAKTRKKAQSQTQSSVAVAKPGIKVQSKPPSIVGVNSPKIEVYSSNKSRFYPKNNQRITQVFKIKRNAKNIKIIPPSSQLAIAPKPIDKQTKKTSIVAKKPVTPQHPQPESIVTQKPVTQQQPQPQSITVQQPLIETLPQPQSIVAQNPVTQQQPQPQSITDPKSVQDEIPTSIVDRAPVVQERSTPPESTVSQEPIAIVQPRQIAAPPISPESNSQPIEKPPISPESNSQPIEKPPISPESNSQPIEKPPISPAPIREPLPYPRPIASPSPIQQPLPYPRPIASPSPIQQPLPYPRPIASPAPIQQPLPYPRPIASPSPIQQPLPYPRPIASPAPIQQPLPYPRSPLPNPRRSPVRLPQPPESSGAIATLDLNSIRGGNRDIPDQLARPRQNQKQIDVLQIGSSVVSLDVFLQIDDRGRLAAIGNVKASSNQGSSSGKSLNFEAIARQLFRDWEFQPARSGSKPVYSELWVRVTIKPLFGRL
ncbi:hypothetical protein [Microcoleus sp.]|uniref:hypothetical protein n=1 Tax=Microcoleus sp. TaxID=44472 RepID=UPI003523CD16